VRTFSEIAQELHEAKFMIPLGHTELKREIFQVGGDNINIVYTQCEEGITVFLNGQEIQETFEDGESLKVGMNTVKNMLRDMSEEGISIEEITNEINF